MSHAKYPQPSSQPHPQSKMRGPWERVGRLMDQARAEDAARVVTPPKKTRRKKAR